jgi:rare lipoprotein A (peptidoglycan hydrolase)
VVITLALLPALLPGLAQGDASEVRTADPASTPSTELAATHTTVGGVAESQSLLAVTTTTTTVAPPTTTTTRPRPTTTTTAPKPKPKVVLAAPAPAPTTTVPKPKPTTTAPPATGSSQVGRASWYEQVQGTCAHRSLPFGTVVTVTDNATGASVTCTVGDRGPFVSDLIIDLSPADFGKLAPTTAGVVGVTLHW